MKPKDEYAHIKIFQQLFVLEKTQNNLKHTQQNFYELKPTTGIMPQSMLIEEHHPIKKQQKNKVRQQISNNQDSFRQLYKRGFKLIINRYLFQLCLGYTLTICLMLLNRVVYFPFFQGLMIIIISLSTKPTNITNFLILLALPMAIANYNLKIWVITYPRYLFSNRNPRMLIWIVTTSLYTIFGFIILPNIVVNIPLQNKYVLYYIFPWLLVIVKQISAFLNHIIVDSNLFLLQIPLFLTGLSYGMLLTLDIVTIQFWYLIITLTLDIINTRYQFSLNLLKKITKQKHLRSIIQPQSSGYVAINSLHIVFFVYAVGQLTLNSAHFFFDIQVYFIQWYKPIIVWIFFIIYQIISMVKLWKWQNFLIVGYQDNTWRQSFKRGLGLSLGLWFFYLGLGIPSFIFAV